MNKIAYYITAHGYGHGARSCDILKALRKAAPQIPIIVKTDLPIEFMQSRLPDSIEIRTGAFDVGLIQKDSIHADVKASLNALENLYQHEQELIQQEVSFLLEENIGIVVADIPAIPLLAAQSVGIPNVATSNFGWDWIYSEFTTQDPRWQFFINRFSNAYKKTDLLLRQPFAEAMTAFPNQIDLPLMADPGTSCRSKIAKATNANPNKPWVLLSFTSLNLDEQARQKISTLTTHEFFTVEPLEWPNTNIHCLKRSLACFADILASCDIIITKPGFGIVSECIANDKPIIYSDRKNFLEYPILVEAIKTYCQHGFISNTDLYAGNLNQALSEIKNAPPPTKEIERNGAHIAAEQILIRLDQYAP